MSDKPPEFNLHTATLIELIDFRESMYQNLTQTAFKPFESKLSDAVTFFLNTKSPVHWLTVEKLKDIEGFVTISGFVLPEIGSTFKASETDSVVITPDNFQKFRSLVRFVIPVRLLEEGSKMQILGFIRDLSAISAITPPEELERMLKEFHFDDMVSLTSHESYNKMLDKVTKPKEIDGFDVSEFSDEQIKQMHMFTHARSETRN